MADGGEIQVKVLLFPLPMHKGAREQCVAVVCDKKGFDDLESGYKSDNQCANGAKLVDETIALLSSKGVSGTPTYLFPDGRFQSGLSPDALRQRLGIGAPATTATPKATGTGKVVLRSGGELESLTKDKIKLKDSKELSVTPKTVFYDKAGKKTTPEKLNLKKGQEVNVTSYPEGTEALEIREGLIELQFQPPK